MRAPGRLVAHEDQQRSRLGIVLQARASRAAYEVKDTVSSWTTACTRDLGALREYGVAVPSRPIGWDAPTKIQRLVAIQAAKKAKLVMWR